MRTCRARNALRAPIALLALASLALAPAAAPAAPPTAPPARVEKFDALVDQFFERWFEFHPEEATRLGGHRFDDRLAPITAASVDAARASLRHLEARLAPVA